MPLGVLPVGLANDEASGEEDVEARRAEPVRYPLAAQVAEAGSATEDCKSKGLAWALYVGAVAV